jgi:tetratricopeptide (TPR) repeat protein
MREAELRGQPARAAQFYVDLATMRKTMGATDPVADSVALARLDILVRGRMPEGVRRLDAVVDKRPSIVLADLYARAGNAAKAKAVLVRYETSTPGGVRGSASVEWHEARGDIALAERRYADAVREFRASDVDTTGVPAQCVECAPLNLARAFDAASQGDSAIASIERYLTIPMGRGVYTHSDAYSLRAAAHERLGQLYEARGNAAMAAEHDRAFIELWKNADPELQPRVINARRRLAKLTPVEKPRN